MSDLVPSVVPLSAGLSLQVPKLMAPPGSLTSVLNYEQVDMQGQKRIDGYARYDGGILSALDDFLVLDEADVGPTPPTFGILTTDTGAPYAVVLAVVGDAIHVASLNDNLLPPHQKGRDVVQNPEEHYELLLSYMENLRERTEQLPGPVSGLHWFRDRLYSVTDLVTLSIYSTSPIYPNDNLTVGATDVRVLQSYRAGNNYVVLVDSLTSEGLDAPGTAVYRGMTTIGTVVVYSPRENAPPLASFFESRSESQVLSEDTSSYDFGWRFKHLGWEVLFEKGLSLYGGLPSLNQNLGDIGFGWSTTAGNNGSPLVLTQDVTTTNIRPQVNGWKNSNTPTTYGLSPSNITSTDSSYIYADAYVSWDGDTRAINVQRDNLTEYPPTANVEVDIT